MPVGKPSKFNEALRLAKRIGLKMPHDRSWEQVRDYLDQATAADLDAWQLDKVTDACIKVRDAQPMEN